MSDANEIPPDVLDMLDAAAEQPPAQLLRALRPSDIRCDAGELVGEASCRCSIERSIIDGRTSPESITAFCMGEYEACPTWIKNREAEWKGLPSLAALMKMAEEQRVDDRARKVVRAARLAQAEELLKSDTVEGRRFRARVTQMIEAGAARVRP